MMTKKQFFLLKLIALFFLLVEVVNLMATMFYDPYPHWRGYGASFIYILMFSAMFFMLTRLKPSELSGSASQKDMPKQ